MYLLDTDHITILQWQTQPEYARVRSRMSQHPSQIHYSIVSLHEQTMGANAYVSRARSLQDVLTGYRLYLKILNAFAATTVLPFDLPASLVFDSQRKQQVRIGTMDLRIASIALAHQLVVVTRNASDFRRVPGLTIEDWTV